MKGQLVKRERVLADNGYSDFKCRLHTPGDIGTTLTILCVRHETLNGRIKLFTVLHNRFRHTRDKHAGCFHSVANIFQLEISNGFRLFGRDIQNGFKI